MNLQELRYFAAVVEFRHFGRAAESCNVSQPTLSSQIRKLEEELGVTLLERTNKRVEVDSGRAADPGACAAGAWLRLGRLSRWRGRRAIRWWGAAAAGGDSDAAAPYLLPLILGPLEASVSRSDD